MSPTESQILESIIESVKSQMLDAEGGHDWWHIHRVYNNARAILREHNEADAFIVLTTVLVHDIADAKFYNGDENIGFARAKSIMEGFGIDHIICNKVLDIMCRMSFRNSLENDDQLKNIELSIVQDADRLDALGAIGIARAFSYGGYKNRQLYDPKVLPIDKISKVEYVTSNSPTINHFYEKLLKLKELMNTDAGKRMAAERHEFMEIYLAQFFKEWENLG